MKFTRFHCGVCNGWVIQKTGAGRLMEYRRGLSLPVPDEYPIATCEGCGEEYFTVEEGEALRKLQAPLYAAWQSAHCGKVVERLRERHGVTLREIEAACGVTGTYLSHVLAGRKEASRTLISLLEAYSLNPSEFERRRAGGSWEAADALLGATLVSAPRGAERNVRIDYESDALTPPLAANTALAA